MPGLPINDAILGASTPAFVQAPTFVFVPAAPPPSRSEVLRRQIDAARSARSAAIW